MTLDPDYYHYERYRPQAESGGALAAYYALKPLIPRALQLGARRLYAHRQARRPFPAWPIEPIALELERQRLRALLLRHRARRLAILAYWPDRKRFAFALTHDVEGPAGIANIERVLEVERKHGFISAWNFVAEDYEIPAGVFELLSDAGCEIGLHGISHDCKLFQSRRRFEAQLPLIHAYMSEWGASGFRSPATHRRAEWMHELGCLYDSSFPDSDPFEPHPGGCCSIFPFTFGDLVELPITLAQDHTLFAILRARGIEVWLRKAQWIIQNNGLINVITHPDYLVSQQRLACYDELLGFLADQEGGWHALPREIALWWRARSRSEVLGAQPQADAWSQGCGPCAPLSGCVAWLSERDGKIIVET